MLEIYSDEWVEQSTKNYDNIKPDVIFTDSATSKLTIAKDRCTIKICNKDKVYFDRIIDMSTLINNKISPVENTNRGQFNLVNGLFEITMSKFKTNKEVTYTFREGEI